MACRARSQGLAHNCNSFGRVFTLSFCRRSEALHGVAHSPGVHFGGDLPSATSFPQVCTTAAAFNKSLITAVGSSISTELRAFNNKDQSGLTAWTPNINVFVKPRWGRGQETPGEDPTANGIYAKHFVSAFQAIGDEKVVKASACLKHWDACEHFVVLIATISWARALQMVTPFPVLYATTAPI